MAVSRHDTETSSGLQILNVFVSFLLGNPFLSGLWIEHFQLDRRLILRLGGKISFYSQHFQYTRNHQLSKMPWVSESITASKIISLRGIRCQASMTICLARFGKMAETVGGDFCWNPHWSHGHWIDAQSLRKCLVQEALHRLNAESTRCGLDLVLTMDPSKDSGHLNANHPCLRLQFMVIYATITKHLCLSSMSSGH